MPFPWADFERRAAGPGARDDVEEDAVARRAGEIAHERALQIADRHRRTRRRAQVIGVLLSVAGFVLAGVFGQRIAADHAALSWPTAQGKVTVSQRSLMSRNPDRYETHFIYEFKAKGRYWTSRKVRFAGGQGDPTAEHRVGDKLKVYYDPADPKRAVLEPGVILWAWAQLAACLVVAGLGALYVFLSRRGRPV